VYFCAVIYVRFSEEKSYLPGSTFAVKVIDEKRINMGEISSNWLISEQRRDSDIADIVSKFKISYLAEDFAITYELRAGKYRGMAEPAVYRWCRVLPDGPA